jgi:hypothetical protein
VGDSGSAVNFIRNIITLSPTVHWPHDWEPRLPFLLDTAYPTQLSHNLSKWMGYEYQLRTWKRNYDVDVSNSIDGDINNEKLTSILESKQVAFVVHWLNDAAKIINSTENIKVVVVAPKTKFGLFWQIRAFVEKCGIDYVPNYTFTGHDIDHAKKEYIAAHGLDQYHRENTLNMYEIIGQRCHHYRNFGAAHGIVIDLEDLFAEKTFLSVINKIKEYLKLDISVDQASVLRSAWWNLHWDIETTKDFPWLKYDSVAV